MGKLDHLEHESEELAGGPRHSYGSSGSSVAGASKDGGFEPRDLPNVKQSTAQFFIFTPYSLGTK